MRTRSLAVSMAMVIVGLAAAAKAQAQTVVKEKTFTDSAQVNWFTGGTNLSVSAFGSSFSPNALVDFSSTSFDPDTGIFSGIIGFIEVKAGVSFTNGQAKVNVNYTPGTTNTNVVSVFARSFSEDTNTGVRTESDYTGPIVIDLSWTKRGTREGMRIYNEFESWSGGVRTRTRGTTTSTMANVYGAALGFTFPEATPGTVNKLEGFTLTKIRD